jgi:shikimate dehydrogenase
MPSIKKFYSISQYPGTTGKYYYKYFFKHYNINATYTPLGCPPKLFNDMIVSLLNDSSTSGISISMPYKNIAIQYCNELSEEAKKYNLCNTIFIESNNVTGYNCDYMGVLGISKEIHPNDSIAILGSGSIGKMFYDHMVNSKYNVKLYSRSIGNWNNRHNKVDVIINCTALGTISDDSPLDYIPISANRVIDLSMKKTELWNQCMSRNIKYIGGLEFYCHQFIDQFKKYTGIIITKDSFELAGQQRT